MPSITFKVDGTPVAKARARVRRDGRAYTPAKTREYEEAIGWAAKETMTYRELEMAPKGAIVQMQTNFIFPMPKSWSKKKQQQMCGNYHCQTPDISNLVKAVEDACKGIVYPDDAQIATISAQKWWGPDYWEAGSTSARFIWGDPAGETA